MDILHHHKTLVLDWLTLHTEARFVPDSVSTWSMRTPKTDSVGRVGLAINPTTQRKVLNVELIAGHYAAGTTHSERTKAANGYQRRVALLELRALVSCANGLCYCITPMCYLFIMSEFRTLPSNRPIARQSSEFAHYEQVTHWRNAIT